MTLSPTEPPVFVHIGLAKTGTTTLQRNYFSQAPAINYLGKKNGNIELTHANRAVTRRPDRKYDPEETRNVFEKHLGAPGVAIFSDEDMTVYKFLHPRQMGARVGRLFRNPRLIYVARRPRDWIKSQYFFRLSTYNLDCLNGINPWLDRHFARDEVGSDITEISFAETFRVFHDAAGKPPFLILPYEMMVKDTDAFLAEIERFMGLDGELRRLRPEAETDPKKRRIAAYQANFIRTLELYRTDRDAFLDRVTFFARYGSAEMQRNFRRLRSDPATGLEQWIEFFTEIERRIATRGQTDEKLQAMLSGGDDYEIRPDLKARIAEVEARETAAMQRDYGVDLTPFGYGSADVTR
jgi:hypothetical protein